MFKFINITLVSCCVYHYWNLVKILPPCEVSVNPLPKDIACAESYEEVCKEF